MGAALLGFLLGAVSYGAVPTAAVGAVLVFAGVIAASSWWATPGASACIAVVGYLFTSSIAAGSADGPNWGPWMELIVFAAFAALALVVSLAGRRPAHVALKDAISSRLSSVVARHPRGHARH